MGTIDHDTEFKIDPHHYFHSSDKFGMREFAVGELEGYDNFRLGIPFLRAYHTIY